MKLKPAEMSSEVLAMVDVRHQAEQRGHFSPLGRLLHLETAHGVIQFPTERGEGTGPDLAFMLRQMAIEGVEQESQADENTLLVLGPWTGLPALRHNSTTPCPKCRHVCYICDGGGQKQCEGYQCGGRGWIPGKWLPCSGPGCSSDTGKINAEGCEVCHGSGMIAEELVCPMCNGTKLMTCPGCKGSGEFSTGFTNGSIDWRLPRCKACDGTGFKGKYVKQDVEKFTNAELANPNKYRPGVGSVTERTLVLGPIFSFGISDFATARSRIFDVSVDSAGDLLVLLVPVGKYQAEKYFTLRRAYLVGGVVRERNYEFVSRAQTANTQRAS